MIRSLHAEWLGELLLEVREMMRSLRVYSIPILLICMGFPLLYKNSASTASFTATDVCMLFDRP